MPVNPMEASQTMSNFIRSTACKFVIVITCLQGSTACATPAEITKEDLRKLDIQETEYIAADTYIYTSEHVCETILGIKHVVSISGTIRTPDTPGGPESVITAFTIDGNPVKKSTIDAINAFFPRKAEQVRPYVMCGTDDIRITIPYVDILNHKVVEDSIDFQIDYESNLKPTKEIKDD